MLTTACVTGASQAIEDDVDDLLADGVVAASVVVGGVLLAGDELLGMEELGVRARLDLVNDGRLQVDEDRARHMLARARLGEERAERVVAVLLVLGREVTVRRDAVLQAVQLPARVAHLHAGLADMDRNNFSLFVLFY